jgi:hypothetical protein
VKLVPAASALLLAALLAGCAGTAAPTTSSAPTPTDSTTPLTTVQAGDCFDEVDGDSVDILDCGSAHGYEVFASLLVADGDYSQATIGTEAEARCRDAFGTFVGLEYDASALGLRYVAPSRQTWAQGDREVLCVVFDPDGPTTGTLAAAGR